MRQGVTVVVTRFGWATDHCKLLVRRGIKDMPGYSNLVDAIEHQTLACLAEIERHRNEILLDLAQQAIG